MAYKTVTSTPLKYPKLAANGLLLSAAAIWGFAFVAQRLGMQFVGPFTFNAVRFALGSLSLLPLFLLRRPSVPTRIPIKTVPFQLNWITGGGLLGIVLFIAASLQQIGLVYTTAGKAGFITGLYVILVPLLGLFWKQIISCVTWLGALLATVGMYFLSISEKLTIEAGDLLVLISALFWAGHVQLIGWLTQQITARQLALVQFAVCSILSGITAVIFESIRISAILKAAGPILYGGILSVGVAYTLQVVAQKKALPTHAAIILSLEAVFAVIGGWLILNEQLALRALIGCSLMLAGMLLAQLKA